MVPGWSERDAQSHQAMRQDWLKVQAPLEPRSTRGAGHCLTVMGVACAALSRLAGWGRRAAGTPLPAPAVGGCSVLHRLASISRIRFGGGTP